MLAPMSLALFGYAEGDDIEWQFPTGISSIKIVEVEKGKGHLNFWKYEPGVPEAL